MTTIKSDVTDETKPLTRLIVSKTSKVDDDPNSLDTVIRWEEQWIMRKIILWILETSSGTSRIIWTHSRRLSRLINWVIKMNFLYSFFSCFSYETETKKNHIFSTAANLTAQSCKLSRAYYLKYYSHHHQLHRRNDIVTSQWCCKLYWNSAIFPLQLFRVLRKAWHRIHLTIWGRLGHQPIRTSILAFLRTLKCKKVRKERKSH